MSVLAVKDRMIVARVRFSHSHRRLMPCLLAPRQRGTDSDFL